MAFEGIICPACSNPVDESILEENMILTLEPCFEYLPGKMLVQEENILIKLLLVIIALLLSILSYYI